MTNASIKKKAERFDNLLRRTNPESGCTHEEQRTAAELACAMLRKEPMVIMPTATFAKLKQELEQRRRAMAPRPSATVVQWSTGWTSSGTGTSSTTL